MRTQLILASASPRRAELLRDLGLKFKIIPSRVKETLPRKASAATAKRVVALAAAKAQEVAKRYPDRAVLGADTVVILRGKILGKPKDSKDAQRMLKALSGSTHSVITGLALVHKHKVHTDYEKTKVVFRKLSRKFIEDYVKSGTPLDKAGAYGIQEQGDVCVKRIEGDYNNVVGLPLAKVKKLLASIGFQIDPT